MKSKGLAMAAASFLAMGMAAPVTALAASPGSPSLSSLASQAGILPTSPFYGIKRLWESVELWFTFSSAGKAQLYSYLATVRAAEAAALLTRHNASDALKIFAQYTQDLQQAGSLLPTVVTQKTAQRTGTLVQSLAQAAEDGQAVAAQAPFLPAAQQVRATSQTALAEATIAAPLTSSTTGSPRLLSSGSMGGLTLLASAVAEASHTSLNQVVALYDQSHSWSQVAHTLHASLGSVLDALAGQFATVSSGSTGTSLSGSSGSGSTSVPTSSSPPPSSLPTTNANGVSGESSSPSESQSPESRAPEAQSLESQTPESQKPESQKPESPEAEGAVVGTVAAISTSSVTVNQTSYAMAPGVTVTYHDWVLSTSAIATGMPVKLSLHGGNVTHIKILSDPNLPAGDSVTGTISSISGQTVSIAGYTLSMDPTAIVKYHDFVLSVSQVPTGVEATAHLNNQGVVVKIKLKTDPHLPSGHSLEGTLGAITANNITVGSYTLPMISGVETTWDGQAYSASLQPGWTVRVHLNTQGQVVQVKILSGPSASNSSSSQDN